MPLGLAIEWQKGFGAQPTVAIDMELFDILKAFPGANICLKDNEIDIIICVHKDIGKNEIKPSMN